MPLGYSPLATAGIGAAGSYEVLPPAATTFGVTGVQAAGAVGAVTVKGKAVVVDARFSDLGMRLFDSTSVTVVGKANVAVTGVSGAGINGRPGSVLSGSNLSIFILTRDTALEAVGRVGDVNVIVFTANVNTNTLAVAAAQGQAGAVTVTGDVTSVVPVGVVGVEAYGRLGDAVTVNSVGVTVSVPGMRGELGETQALPSSFGSNLANVQASAWTPIRAI